MADLHGVNLNLLAALDALLVERHVGRAAQRAGVTQSAMSHSLRQLRELLDDPILVRAGRKMLPTPRAEALAPLLRDGMRALDQVLRAQAAPDPATFTQTFTLAVQDAPSAVLLPELLGRLRAEAPGARLSLVAPGPRLERDLEQGRVDLAFVPPVAPPAGVRARAVSSEDAGVVVLGRADHPALQGALDLDTYCALPHAMMTVTGVGQSWVDHVLAAQGRSREVVLRLPYGLAAPSALLDSDLVVTMPALVARYFLQHFALRTAPAPFDAPPMDMLLVWHERYEAEPAHRWFRELVIEIVDAY